MPPKMLGILGGLGPMATVYFYELVTRHTRPPAIRTTSTSSSTAGPPPRTAPASFWARARTTPSTSWRRTRNGW